MPKREFMNGQTIKYTPDSIVHMNGEHGRVWAYWRKTEDGAWLDMGKQFCPTRYSRKEVALQFGHDYTNGH